MTRYLFSFAMAASLAFAQYKMEPASAPPAELAPAVAAALQAEGAKILGPNGAVLCEVWFRKSIPAGAKSSEADVALPAIPQGALLGAIRYSGRGEERRGQTIKPGVYTLRYSLHPVNGDHLGVAPQRDFALLAPAALDQDPESKPDFDKLMDLSRKASGTPHPAVLSMATPIEGAKIPSFAKEGENDWAINVTIGDQPVSMILIGKSEH